MTPLPPIPAHLAADSAPALPGAGAKLFNAPEPDLSPPALWVWQAGVWVVHRPWLAAVAATALVAWIAGRNLLASWRHRRHATGARLVTIAPPPQVDPHSSASFLANLAGTLTPVRWRRLLYGTPHTAWQYTWTGRHLLVSVWVPGSVPKGAVEAAVRGVFHQPQRPRVAPLRRR